MGSGDRDPRGSARREILLRRVKWALRGAVIAYVVLYAILYKNTHLRREPVTGSLYVDLWPSKEAKNTARFALLPYCGDPARPCGFVNEVDLFAFKDNFVPTSVKVAQQQASCLDGADTDTCQLDFKTDAEAVSDLGGYFVGDVEQYMVAVTHAFGSEGFREMTMLDAVGEDVPPCSFSAGSALPPPVGFCRDAAGGHDLATVEGLLAAGGVHLSGNNDLTNHPQHFEPYRSSGMKLRLRVRYSNIAPWWSLLGRGQVGYRYEVDLIPARSVYRELTIRSREEMRAWVHPAKLDGMKSHDRLLVWADGIDIATHVVGEVGHLDLSALLVLMASAMPLLYFAGNIAEQCVNAAPSGETYESMDAPEELSRVMDVSLPMPEVDSGEASPI